MTNEEKASQIIEETKELISKFQPKNPPSFEDGLYYGAIEMARWKDQQFLEFLDKVSDTIQNSKTPQFNTIINAMKEWVKK